jgi:hypothetical protein
MEPDCKVKPPSGGLDEDIANLIERGCSEAPLEIYSPLPRHAAPSPPPEHGAAVVHAAKMKEVVKTLPELYLLPPLPWASHTQLIVFRATATKIADELSQGSRCEGSPPVSQARSNTRSTGLQSGNQRWGKY